MHDRQYVSSLAVSAGLFVLGLSGTVSLLLWLGWVGAVGLALVAAGFLAWFYWGPRPDLAPGGRSDGGNRPHDE